MRLSTYSAACAFLAFASAAPAQVTAIVTGGTTTVTLNGYGLPPITGAVTSKGGHNTASQISSPASNEAGNYQVVSNLTPNDISFGNNASAEGGYAYVTSTTRLAITFRNDGTQAVAPRISSTITPGGFGFYTASSLDPNGTGVGDINTSSNLSTVGFANFGNSGDPYLAGASFAVHIASGGVSIESLAEALTISPAVTYGQFAHGPIVSLTGNGSSLNNFGLVTASGSPNAIGYQWSATDILLTLPGPPLMPGQSHKITYDTTVTSFTDGRFTNGLCGTGVYCLPQLFAFAGFGDPLGKSVGTGTSAPTHPENGPTPTDPAIGGVTFSRFSIGLPTFDGNSGTLSVPVSPTLLPSLPLTSAVPEPATWALMLLGVGVLGLRLRRRSRVAAAHRPGPSPEA